MKAMFSSNWQMKIVALIFAVVIYLYTARQVSQEATLDVVCEPNAVIGLPDDYRVASVNPREFSVRVSGPAAVLRRLRESAKVKPRLELSAEAISAGKQSFPVTTTLLGIDAEVRILDPHEITVGIGRVETQDMWVEPPRLVRVPSGIRATLTLERDRVKVTGADSALAALNATHQRLQFKAVNLDGVQSAISEPTERRIFLEPDVGVGIQVEEVTARLLLTPVGVRRQQVTIPVRILGDPQVLAEHRVTLAAPQVTLSLRGPARIMDEFDAQSGLNAWVDLRGMSGSQTKDLPVVVDGPDWIQVEPVSLAVTIAPRADG